MTHKERVASLMLHLKCTEAEAEDIIAYDAQVDKGEPTKYDLTPEQMKITKKYRNTGTREKKPTNYEFTQREKKANPTKSAIISKIAEMLVANGYEAVDIVKKEREVNFKVGETEFTVMLTQHRPKK